MHFQRAPGSCSIALTSWPLARVAQALTPAWKGAGFCPSARRKLSTNPRLGFGQHLLCNTMSLSFHAVVLVIINQPSG